MKYILVTGGVISGLGKGVISSSLGALLKGFNLNVTAIKIDPYINIDAGTFSPYEHGEVFVLDDGGEVDLDLGNYERFLNIRLGRDNNITTGKIFERVISKERQGAYLGRTVQYIPHITDEIQLWVENIAHQPVRNDNNGVGGTPQICIIELGGTIGDIESAPFVEAFRFLQRRVGIENFLNVHLSPVLEPKSVGEQKTKPTQRSVQELRKLGLHPDLIMCRCENPISDKIREKISLFCDVSSDQVISVHDVESIYQIPTLLFEQNVVKTLNKILRLNLPIPLTLSHLSESSSIKKWVHLAEAESKCREEVKITLVGKYTKLEDSYASVIKALHHAGIQLERKIRISYVEGCDLVEKERAENFSEERYTKAWNELKAMDGLLVPGGFDMRGVEGMINAIKFARSEKKPFLGICLGFQCATIEFARNEVGLIGANSTEFNPKTEHKVVIDMPEHTTGDMGGTMRLGLRTTHFTSEYSLLRQLYDGANSIEERHRHRYEVNPEYVSQFEKKGLKFTGKDSEKVRMEVLEYHDHPYFVAIQYHPEFLSRPLKPSPPFLGLIAASSKQLDKLLKS